MILVFNDHYYDLNDLTLEEKKKLKKMLNKYQQYDRIDLLIFIMKKEKECQI